MSQHTGKCLKLGFFDMGFPEVHADGSVGLQRWDDHTSGEIARNDVFSYPNETVRHKREHSHGSLSKRKDILFYFASYCEVS